MLEHLSFGGGIVSLKEQFDIGTFDDLGFCPNFSLNVNVTQDFKEEYFTDSSGNLVRVPSTVGSIAGVAVDGEFSCESMTRNLLQKIWFHGDSTDAGTELFGGALLQPIIRALKFLSVPESGPTYCLTLPAVELRAKGTVPLIGDNWKSISFTYRILYASNMRTAPVLRVQEEGESLSNFCV